MGRGKTLEAKPGLLTWTDAVRSVSDAIRSKKLAGPTAQLLLNKIDPAHIERAVIRLLVSDAQDRVRREIAEREAAARQAAAKRVAAHAESQPSQEYHFQTGEPLSMTPYNVEQRARRRRKNSLRHAEREWNDERPGALLSAADQAVTTFNGMTT